MACISIKNKTISRSMLVGNAPFIPTSFESIATVTVGAGGSSSISFTSIPSTFTHLQIRGIMKQAGTSVDIEYLIATFNSSSTGYSYHNIRGDGSSVVASGAGSQSNAPISVASPSNHSSYANMFGTAIIDILDYANTNKFKTIRTLGGMDGNGSGNINVNSGAWQNTAAITRIDLTSQSFNFVQYSSFALYGIKGV